MAFVESFCFTRETWAVTARLALATEAESAFTSTSCQVLPWSTERRSAPVEVISHSGDRAINCVKLRPFREVWLTLLLVTGAAVVAVSVIMSDSCAETSTDSATLPTFKVKRYMAGWLASYLRARTVGLNPGASACAL